MLQWTLVPSFFFYLFIGRLAGGLVDFHLLVNWQAPGNRGAGGAHATPRIWVLYSKNFQNGQNFIFFIIRAPLGKNRSQGPVNWM